MSHQQYITFNERRNAFLLFSEYDEDLIDRLHNEVGGANWIPEARAWSVPNEIVPVKQLIEACRPIREIRLDAQAVAAWDRLATEADFFERLSGAESFDRVNDGNLFEQRSVSQKLIASALAAAPDLLPFQQVGVAYGVAKQRCFVADDMGTGKTFESLMILRLLRGFPALVTCKASAIGHWKREAAKWAPELSVIQWPTNRGWPTASDADITLLTWGQLSKIHQPASGHGIRIRWPGEGIVFDESHHAKERDSKRTQKAKALSGGVRVRLAITGSVALNRPIELVAQLQILGRLNDMGGFWPFVKRYCAATQGRYGWEMDGASNLKELNYLLRQTCFFRREKSLVLPQLPPKRREIVDVELSEKQLEAYRKAEEVVISKLIDSDADAEGIINFHLKHLIGQAKVLSIADWINDFLEDSPQEKLVVFAHHHDVIAGIIGHVEHCRSGRQTIHRPGICARLTGEDSPTAREAAQKRFREDPECRVFVANMEAGGESIELFTASTVLFAELGWTPGGHDQAEDRLHRMGQKEAVIAYYFLAKGTVDEPIYALIEQKRKNISQLQGDKPLAATIADGLRAKRAT